MLTRSAVVVASLVLSSAAATAAVAGPDAHPHASGKQITGDKTTIVLNAASRKAMKAHHYKLEPTGAASLKHGTLTLPVTGGTYNGPTNSVVKQAGGFTISKGSKSVTVRKLVVHSNSLSATAHVTGNNRITAVTIGIPSSHSETDTTATFSGYQVTLSDQLVKILDAKFGTKQFAKHADIGTGTTDLTFS
jgi:hypothetical protein